MIEKLKQHSSSLLIFVINILLAVIGFIVIRDRDKIQALEKRETTISLTPVDSQVAETQNLISQNREAKLRDQNTAPKGALKVDNITTKTTTTSNPSPSSNSSSSSSSSSKTTTTTKTS